MRAGCVAVVLSVLSGACGGGAGSTPSRGAAASTPTPTSVESDSGAPHVARASGGAEGRLVDPRTGAPFVGATVIFESQDGARSATAITDERGAYDVRLPPGTYRITIYYVDDATYDGGVLEVPPATFVHRDLVVPWQWTP